MLRWQRGKTGPCSAINSLMRGDRQTQLGACGRAARRLRNGQPAQADAAPFADLLTDAVGAVNQLGEPGPSAVSGLMTGTGVDVHQAMIATEKASMAFEMALAVRNKAVQSYQQVIGMQF